MSSSIFLFVRVCRDNGKFSDSPFAAAAFVRIHLLFAPVWGSGYNYSPQNADIVTEKEKELTYVYLASNSLGELEFERGQGLGLDLFLFQYVMKMKCLQICFGLSSLYYPLAPD